VDAKFGRPLVRQSTYCDREVNYGDSRAWIDVLPRQRGLQCVVFTGKEEEEEEEGKEGVRRVVSTARTHCPTGMRTDV
jgi:hypothetical protein